MKKCVKCGAEQPEGSTYCSECGEKLEAVTPIVDNEPSVEEEMVEQESTTEPKGEEELTETVEEETAQSSADEGDEQEEAIQSLSDEGEGQAEASLSLPEESDKQIETPQIVSEKNPKLPIYKKKGLIIGLVVLVVLAIGGFFCYKVLSNRPIDVLKKADVKFEGYDTVGTATYNEEQIETLVKEKAMKKAGISAKDIDKLLKNDKELLKKYQDDVKLNLKLEQAEKMAKNVEFKLSQTTDLSNGSKISFTVKDDNSDKNKLIDEGSKKIEVEGLKDIQEVTVEDVLEDTKYSFSGFNGFGKLVVEKSPYKTASDKLFSKVRDDGNLSNDETVELKINPGVSQELLKKGKKLKRGSSFKEKVTGLKNPMDVGDLGKSLEKIDELTKKYYETIKLEDFDLDIDAAELKAMGADIKFEVTRQESYLRIHTDSATGEPVFDIQSIFKVDATMSAQGASEKMTAYEARGFLEVPVVKDKLDFAGEFILPVVFEKSMEDAIKELKNTDDGYQKIELGLGADNGEKV